MFGSHSAMEWKKIRSPICLHSLFRLSSYEHPVQSPRPTPVGQEHFFYLRKAEPPDPPSTHAHTHTSVNDRDPSKTLVFLSQDKTFPLNSLIYRFVHKLSTKYDITSLFPRLETTQLQVHQAQLMTSPCLCPVHMST